MKKYLLHNRYGDKNYLEQITDNKYKLSSGTNLGIRLIFNYDNSIVACDPSGGPLISVGDNFKNICIDCADNIIIKTINSNEGQITFIVC